MYKLSEKERKVNKFCDKGGLEEYREFITELFNEIENTHCKIAARDDSEISLHSYNEDGCLIRISLSKKYPKPTYIIWTILHEFGHHFDPIKKEDKNDINKIIESEEKAWNWAYNYMKNHTLLKEMEFDFFKCKSEYMDTYYKKRDSLKKKQ